MCYHWIDISRPETVDALLVSIESGRPKRQSIHQSESVLELPKTSSGMRDVPKERMRMQPPAGLLRSFLMLRKASLGRL
ncbi:hypothetical protein ACFONN_09710 [Dyella humi]|uniref:hypothetical protein n=1 Tax=Dyella humi TaxID=1770547 RepID=UPI0036230A7E